MPPSKDDHAPDRGAFALPVLAQDRTYDIVEAAEAIAVNLGIAPAAVALAWIRSRRPMTSTILGVRSIAQLDTNLAALDVSLDDEQLRTLDETSRPQLGFPGELLTMIGRVAYGGTTIDGVEYATTPFAPKGDADRA